MSANSAHASASVGEASRNLFNAVTASGSFLVDLNSAMRRFATGYSVISEQSVGGTNRGFCVPCLSDRSSRFSRMT